MPTSGDVLELPEALGGADDYDRQPTPTGSTVAAPVKAAPRKFDVTGALRDGFTTTEIADRLAKEYDFDAEAARRDGFSDNDIVAKLAGLRKMGRAGSIAAGVTKGATENIPMYGGALAGGGLGAAYGAPLGPLGAIVGGGLGALGGGIAGYKLGQGAQEVSKKLGGTEIDELSPNDRPWFAGGEALGSSLAATPFGAALPIVKAPGMVSKVITAIGETARNAPKTFVAGETGRAMYSAEAGGITEAMYPDQPGKRALAEAAAGMLNPSVALMKLFPAFEGGVASAMNVGKALMPGAGETARTARAAAELQRNLATYGEDPQVLVEMLLKSDIPGVTTTAAQKTGSRTLAAMENFLGKGNAKFKADVEKTGDDAIRIITGALDKMGQSADPQVLQHAADLRARFFNTLLTKRVADAEGTAQAAMAKVAPGDAISRSDISTRAQGAVEEALKASRKAENELWAAVPKDDKLLPENFLGAWKEMEKGLLPGNEMQVNTKMMYDRLRATAGRLSPPSPPKMTDDAVKNAKAQLDYETALAESQAPVRQLQTLRSDYLEDARRANAAGEFGNARVFSRMAAAILDDLDAYGTGKAAYDNARAFSRELNDVFSRTFARDATRTTREGGEKLAPELLLSRAFAGGREAGALRTGQLEEAVNFPGAKGIGGEEALTNAADFKKAEEQFLRTMASETVTDGVVDPKKMLKFVQTHGETLQRFPDVLADLNGAAQAALAAKAMRTRMEAVQPLLRDKNVTAFARLSGFEDPSRAVGQAVTSGNPVANLSTMARFAGRDPQAKAGLEAAVFDHALTQATKGGEFNLAAYANALEEPLGRGMPSLMQLMAKQGIVTPQAMQNSRLLLERAQTIERAMQNPEMLDQLATNPDLLTDTMMRLAGSKLGGMASSATGGGSSGQSFVWAAAGSRAVRKLFEKMNVTTVSDVLRRAATDPTDNYGLMRTLLTQAKTPAERVKNIQQLHGYLINAGMTAAGGSDGED